MPPREWADDEMIVLVYFLSRGVEPRAVDRLIRKKCGSQPRSDHVLWDQIENICREEVEDHYPSLVNPRTKNWSLTAVDLFILRQIDSSQEFKYLIELGPAEQKIIDEVSLHTLDS